MATRITYDRPIKVWCQETREWIDESEVEILNCEEGDQGQDMVTFTCPLCNQEHISRRIS